jgi:hypothetical protein
MSKDKKKTANPDTKKKTSDYQTGKLQPSKFELVPLKKVKGGK